MSKIAVVAKLTAQPDRRADVRAALEKLAVSTTDEAGTLLYVFNQETQNPDVFWFYELYASNEALAAHSGSAAMAEAFGALGDALAEAPLIVTAEPLWAKGLSL